MITLAEVRDWINNLMQLTTTTLARSIISKKIVQAFTNERQSMVLGQQIGGRLLASYDVKSISILIHWNKNANETEKRAQYLYNRLFETESVVIGGTPIKMIALLQNEPVDVGTDDNNVYERVIELDLYYEREREGN